jgi:hypothetical protein
MKPPAEIAGMVVDALATNKIAHLPAPSVVEAWQQRVNKVRNQI